MAPRRFLFINQNIMKQYLLKTFLVALFFITATGASAHDFEVGGIYYNIISSSDLTVEVTYGENEYTGSVVIPSTVTYNSVAYSVTSIGDNAFGYCYGLTSVEIPNSVTSIGESAFERCSNLNCIIIPNSVTSIEDYTFLWCSGLTNIEIPSSVTNIGSNAFSGCSSLTNIEIPSSVTNIDSGAFSGCSSLTNIEIPSSITSIARGVFESCLALTHIAIPNNVTSIEDYTFNNCTGLTSIIVPNSVTSIGDYAFLNCTALKSIYCLLKSPIELLNTTFENVDYDNVVLYVPIGSKAEYKKTDYWRQFVNIKEMEFTGIDNITTEPTNNFKNVYYNLNGSVVENPTNGIYIINGKKVLVE